MNNRSVRSVLRWVVISVLLGAGIGFVIGLAKDMMNISLPLGIGMGLILGLALALQSHPEH